MFLEERMTWYEAKNACNKISGHLVEIDTAEKHNLLVAESQKRGLNSTHNLWIGLNDLDSEGVWRWSQSGEEATFTAWRDGQPNSSQGEQDCAGLEDFGWNDLWCNRRYYEKFSFGAICEM